MSDQSLEVPLHPHCHQLMPIFGWCCYTVDGKQCVQTWNSLQVTWRCKDRVMFICTWGSTFVANPPSKQKNPNVFSVLRRVKFYKIFLLSLQSYNIVLKHSTISIYLRLFTSFKDKIHGNKLKPDSENVLLSIISDYHLVGEGTEHTIKGNLRKVCVSDVSANILYELS